MSITKRIQKVFELAVADKEFMEAMDRQEKKEGEYNWEEKIYDDIGKHLFSVCYWGWLIAKDKTDEAEQQLPPKKKWYQP